MKKLLLLLCIASLMSGCLYWPQERGHGGYSRDDGGHRGGTHGGHGGEHGHDD